MGLSPSNRYRQTWLEWESVQEAKGRLLKKADCNVHLFTKHMFECQSRTCDEEYVPYITHHLPSYTDSTLMGGCQTQVQLPIQFTLTLTHTFVDSHTHGHACVCAHTHTHTFDTRQLTTSNVSSKLINSAALFLVSKITRLALAT